MRISNYSMPEIMNLTNVDNILNNLDIGDKIKVQVLSAESDMFTLRLPDGNIINASSIRPLDVNIGDFLDLMVNGKDMLKVFVEIVDNNEDLPEKSGTKFNNVLKSKLMSLKIPINEMNASIAREITKNDIPFTKEVFNYISENIKEFNYLTPAKAVFLYKNGIEINSENIKILNKYIDHSEFIGNKLNQLTEELSEIGKAMTKNNNIQLEDAKVQTSDFVNIRSTDKNNLEIKTSNEPVIENELKNEFINKNGVHKSEKVINQSEVDKKLVEPNNPNDNFKNLLLQLKNNDDKINLLDKQIKSLFKTIDKSGKDTLAKEIIASKVIKEVMTTTQNIKETMKSLDIPQKHNVLNIVKEIENNVDFIRQLNDNFNYVQIPVNINGEQYTAELYVFKDSKRKNKINPDNATIFLSLFTANLGPIEAFIRVINKGVECEFRSQTEEIRNFIKSNITPLYALIEAKGYKLTKVTYKEFDKDANIINVKEIKKENNKKYSFDIRV